jgi:hypothetical protein
METPSEARVILFASSATASNRGVDVSPTCRPPSAVSAATTNTPTTTMPIAQPHALATTHIPTS